MPAADVVEVVAPNAIADHLNRRVAAIMAEVEASEVWHKVMTPDSPKPLLLAILREIYAEVATYQPSVVAAAVSSIAQLPRDLPAALLDGMLRHQVEQFDHGENALRAYAALGGDAARLRRTPASPGGFAIAAIWRMLTHRRDPFLYLGAVYLFDALTPIVIDHVKAALLARMGGATGPNCVARHAGADLAHAASIRALIAEIAGRYPDRAGSILRGFEHVAPIYPLPVWTAALRRAETQVRVPMGPM